MSVCVDSYHGGELGLWLDIDTLPRLPLAFILPLTVIWTESRQASSHHSVKEQAFGMGIWWYGNWGMWQPDGCHHRKSQKKIEVGWWRVKMVFDISVHEFLKRGQKRGQTKICKTLDFTDVLWIYKNHTKKTWTEKFYPWTVKTLIYQRF